MDIERIKKDEMRKGKKKVNVKKEKQVGDYRKKKLIRRQKKGDKGWGWKDNRKEDKGNKKRRKQENDNEAARKRIDDWQWKNKHDETMTVMKLLSDDDDDEKGNDNERMK